MKDTTPDLAKKSPVTPNRPELKSVRRGVLPREKVRMATFATISLSIFACAVLCILGVWGFSDDGTPWRALASLGIIAGAMVAFTVVNELFGQTVKEPAFH